MKKFKSVGFVFMVGSVVAIYGAACVRWVAVIDQPTMVLMLMLAGKGNEGHYELKMYEKFYKCDGCKIIGFGKDTNAVSVATVSTLNVGTPNPLLPTRIFLAPLSDFLVYQTQKRVKTIAYSFRNAAMNVERTYVVLATA
ncbi:Hypothetical predicted protein, partial [Olea europaea subsp. europaea]